MTKNLSAVILTKNEEKNIIDAIESVEFADEIIIIDDYSTDRTIETIQSLNNHKIKIYKRDLRGNFSKQRNFAIEKTQGKWIFFLDADEKISPGLQGEVKHIMQYEENGKSGFYVKRRDVFLGKELKYGETTSVKLLRLAKKNKGKWIGKVHEVWDVKGKKGNLTYPIYHTPHKNLKEFIQKINIYTTIRSYELIEKEEEIKVWKVIAYPTAKFLQNYILRMGFRDGTIGFIHASFMSFHSFLVRSKVWLHLQKNTKNTSI